MILNNKKIILKTALIIIAALICSSMLSSCSAGGTAVIPKGWAGAVTDDTAIYVGSMEGNIVSIAKTDGSMLFNPVALEKQQSGGGFLGCSQASQAVAMYGSPVINGDLVYVAGYNGRIYAFNKQTGASRWIYPRDGYLANIIGGISVNSNTLYFSSSDGKVYALDAETGDDRVWSEPFQAEGKIWSTPAVEDDTIYTGSFDNKLYAIDANTGKAEWQAPFEVEGAIVSTPVVHNGKVIFGSFDRHIYAVSAATGEEIWRYPVNDEDVEKPGNWFWATPVIYNDVVFAGCLDGYMYIIDTANGRLIKRIDLGKPISSSPVIVGDQVVIAATQERPEKTTIHTIDTDNYADRLILSIEEEVYAPLAAGDGVVYIHSAKDALYEVDASTGAKREIAIKTDNNSK